MTFTIYFLRLPKSNLNNIVYKEMHQLFKTITKSEFKFTEHFNTRNYDHLYDFQKYFLHKAIESLIELVQVKQIDHWAQQKKHINAWQAFGN